MKLTLTLMIVLTVLLASSALAVSCYTSSEDYSVEAVVKPYSHPQFGQVFGNIRQVQSQYDPALITILKETGGFEGLSVRIQIPTKSEELSEPRLEILSEIADSNLILSNEETFNEWKVSCSLQECVFSGEEIIISAKQMPDNVAVAIEFKEALPQCTPDCTGPCMITNTGQKCLENKNKEDIESILKRYNITKSFDNILASYRVVGSEQISVANIVPQIDKQINFQEAMRQELVYLKKLGVIEVSDSDIENIAKLSKAGQAGNYRIVKSGATNKWTYYDKTSNSVLTSELDCSTYNSIDKSFNYRASIKAKVYYVIPIVIVIFAVILLGVLVLVAKIIKRRNHRKNKKV